jgi:glucose-6-phosphate-specific signal transduction histidine kinase
VTTSRADGLLVLRVADDGVGGADPGQGSGLRGLADRIDAVGGRLSVDSPRGKGTRLTVTLPITGGGRIDMQAVSSVGHSSMSAKTLPGSPG